MPDPLLDVRDLRVVFDTPHGEARAVDGVGFTIGAGRTLGMVGESGCGKSVTALSLLRLVAPPGRVAGGQALWRGTDLLALAEPELRRVRGNRVAMVFQEPMTSLNPVLTIGEQIAETLRLHLRLPRAAARDRAAELLASVGIPEPREQLRRYPHQLSGGMRQRAMIAMAISCRPDLLIADEPTTALDVTVQAQILELLARMQNAMGLAMLLITHDLGVVAESCDDVVVLYAGQVVESAAAAELLARPRHPYTAALLASLPRSGDKRLREIPGFVPPAHAWPQGCRFADRCDRVIDRCRLEPPPLDTIEPARLVRCINPVPAAP